MQTFRLTSLLWQRLKTVFGFRPLALILIILMSVLIVLLAIPASTELLEFYFYDVKQRVAARYRSVNSDLVVVGIDMKTLAAGEKRWPWPRQDVARILRLLSGFQPRGIVVDILFQNADREDNDEKLAQAIADLGNIILISVLEEKETPNGVSLVRFTSMQKFSDKALAEGFVWGLIDNDGRQRCFKLREERLNAESAALSAHRHFFSASYDAAVRVQQTAPVVFARKNGGIPVISLLDILDKSESFHDLLCNKVIVLGVNAPLVHDYHHTAIGVVAGVEILASSIDTIVSDRIGNILFNDRLSRFVMLSGGFAFGWYCIMSSLPLLIAPVLFLLLFLVIMIATEIALLHLPIALLVVGWLIGSLVFYTAKYLDNLFSLRTIQHEAETARLVQEQLLPAGELELNGYRAYGVSRSANELGGDYFDYFSVKDRYLLVIIGDATGHGTPSALAMAIGKATVLLGLKMDLSPDQLVESINTVLFNALRRKLMMTAAFLWIDTETHEFEYRNCGHPYPYIYKEDGSIEHLAASGMLLGTKASYRCPTPHRGSLLCGERLLFYTDGLIESIPVTSQQNAFDIFRDYLAKRPKLSLSAACKDILDGHPHALSGQPQPDDFTVLMIEREC